MISRRRFIGGASALCLAALAGRAGAVDQAVAPAGTVPARLLPQWRPQAQFAGFYYALEKGFYREAGVELDLLEGGPRTPAARFLLERRTEFATLFLSEAISLRAAGAPIVNLAQLNRRSSQCLVARKDSGVAKPADLNGRRVSVWPDFSLPSRVFFQKYGLAVEVLPQTASLNLFMRRAVDAASAMRYNELHVLYQYGIDFEELVVFDLAEHGVDFPEDGLYCREDTLREKPELCRAVTEASLKGRKAAFADPETALDLVMRAAGAAKVDVNRVHQVWMLDQLHRLEQTVAEPPGPLDRKGFDFTANAMLAAGVINHIPDFEAFHIDAQTLPTR